MFKASIPLIYSSRIAILDFKVAIFASRTEIAAWKLAIFF